MGDCGVAALGWALLRPHCLCWMRMEEGVGVAWVRVLMKVVFLLTLILYYCLISGPGSSDTPDRSSHGCNCGQAALQGWGLAEEGRCWLPVDHLGCAGAQDPDQKVLSLLLHLLLQLHLSEGQLHCRVCHC